MHPRTYACMHGPGIAMQIAATNSQKMPAGDNSLSITSASEIHRSAGLVGDLPTYVLQPAESLETILKVHQHSFP